MNVDNTVYGFTDMIGQAPNFAQACLGEGADLLLQPGHDIDLNGIERRRGHSQKRVLDDDEADGDNKLAPQEHRIDDRADEKSADRFGFGGDH